MSVCPKCGQVDQVQKVTAIVTSGTTSGTLTYYDSMYYQNSTVLAQRLMPPSEPRIDRPGFCSLILLLLFIGAFLTPLLLLASQYPEARAAIIANGGLSNRGVQTGIAQFIGMLMVPLLLAVWVLAARRSTARRTEQQEQQVLAWRGAIARWNRLYYCFRCDIVHVEGEKTWANPEGMPTLLMDVRDEQPPPSQLAAPTSNVSTTSASIETDAQGRLRCSICKGFVQRDATLCKHCNKQFTS